MVRKLAVLLLLLVPLACDDDPTEPVPVSLTGVWTLTHIELVSSVNPGTRVDFMDEGVTGTLTLEADGDFLLAVTDPVEGTETFTGHWTHAETLILEHLAGDFAGTTWEFQVELGNGVLVLTGADAQFDFDDDGNEDPAILNLTAVEAA
jgi:hypothetical protein